MRKVLTYLSFVRFSHSVFALPFALTGALLAWRDQPFSWSQVVWIAVCMVSARSAAMGFNRLVDARFDALNPRTAMRELPRGALTTMEAVLFVVVSSVVFVSGAARLSPLCLLLSPVALVIVFWYSLAKRYTSYTQLFLGLAMAVAPVGGWIAAGGRGRSRAVAAWSGDRPVGGRVRHSVRVPGPRVRSRARPSIDTCAVWRGTAIQLSRMMHVSDGRGHGRAVARRAIFRRCISAALRSWRAFSPTSSRS